MIRSGKSMRSEQVLADKRPLSLNIMGWVPFTKSLPLKPNDEIRQQKRKERETKKVGPKKNIYALIVTLVSCQPTVYRTIYVDKLGRGNFSTIQSAINSIPSNNTRWICISVMAGHYNEQVKIPKEKPFIYLKGEAKKRTSVIWGSPGTPFTSPTFSSLADNILVKRMTFMNSYNYPPKKGSRLTQAIAALIAGDKSAFYQCSFLGLQDTLLDSRGRHYFKSCNIVGAFDFIYGAGQSIYEGCTITVINGGIDNKLAGFITAQGRESPNDPNGFVFKNCKIVGPRLAYLGRAWREYARVIFFNSSFQASIVPQGWDAWAATGHVYRTTFVEQNCYGRGAKTSGRVKWEKRLSSTELKHFTSISYIDKEGWLNKQPKY
ncbi:probable pectinesterase 29 [Impatiens glandulifera]|uniref:probable pectinesterase 29 n=1 Tax=Impatiens glandulifera TaxID=253017 RepID=UPI001FB08782|nr:probable pectinesterase 29 [Impatiens glandulifera]